jgi:nitroreductase
MTADPHDVKQPDTSVAIAPVLAQRWSPRGFDDGAALTQPELTALLEAARWAPSASNNQPWRFIVGLRGSTDFDCINSCLTGGNLAWANRASALLILVAQVLDAEGSPRTWAEYDTGQAASFLTVQAESMGLSVHQMGGFDRQRVAERFRLNDSLRAMAVLAFGTWDPQAVLPEPFASRERAARSRIPLAELMLTQWPPPGRQEYDATPFSEPPQ